MEESNIDVLTANRMYKSRIFTMIFQDKEKSSVWVYRPADKKVTQRQVKIRKIWKEGRVVLDEGVQSGEIVVTAGEHKLKEGMEVERLKPVADTNIGGLL